MRDRETIDSELRAVALRRQSIRELGDPSSQQIDNLLDERLGHRAAASETASEIEAARDESADVTHRRRKGVPRRIGLLVPLALLAVAVTLVTTLSGHHRHSAEATEVPPPSVSQLKPPAPSTEAPPFDIADRVFIDVLKLNGVPVPSAEYATAHAHAVCGFLTDQPNLAEAVRFVQQSTIWDAGQSAHFATGAVVSYCPQYEFASVQMQPGLQNSLSDLQAVQRDLQRIQGDLQGIRDHLPVIPGDQ